MTMNLGFEIPQAFGGVEHMPTPEACRKVAERLRTATEEYSVDIRMTATLVHQGHDPEHPCRTVCCHAGLYLLARMSEAGTCEWTEPEHSWSHTRYLFPGGHHGALRFDRGAGAMARDGGSEGSCGSHFRYPDNGSINVVMDTAVHGLILSDRTAHKLIIEFLEEHRVP